MKNICLSAYSSLFCAKYCCEGGDYWWCIHVC